MPLSRPAILRYLRQHGPSSATDLSYAFLIEWRTMRDHLHLNRRVHYGTKKDTETGERLWYALP